MHIWEGLEYELEQARDEGLVLDENVVAQMRRALAMPDNAQKAAAAVDAFEAVRNSPRNTNRQEPSSLASIQQLAPGYSTYKWNMPGSDILYDKVLGGWLGRCAGCLLGKPFEGWKRRDIIGLARDTGNYPINRYFVRGIPEEIANRYKMGGRAWADTVDGMPEDDDTNYTLIGLRLLEQSGREFTPQQVATRWLSDLPIHHTFTAERVAYRNLTLGLDVSQTAGWCNPYREWIGAQIRADIFGYANPARPRQAAAMAWLDASISHIKNGIYGEMWVAAMIATAYVMGEPETVIRAGLAEIPPESRLNENVLKVIDWFHEGIHWETVLDRLHEQWDEDNGHHWCHTVSNAMIVTAALMYGQRDFSHSIGMAVMGALDTDCNAATVGSILGVILGASALPPEMVMPLNDKLYSGVDGMGSVSISEMARRTLAVME